MKNRPLDNPLLAPAINELNIARKNALIYPLEHAQVKASMGRLMKSMELILEAAPEITLAVVNDMILFKGECLDKRNIGFQELAVALKSSGIAAMTLHRGLREEEILSFFQQIAGGPEKRKPSGQTGTAESRHPRWPHIDLQYIDYSKLHVTEEAVIHRDDDTGRQNDRPTIWKDFVTRLVADSLSSSEDAVPFAEFPDHDPANLALLLNRNQIDIEQALRSYGRIIDRILEEEGATEDREESEAGIRGIGLLLQELKPELRQQFLAVTFDRIASRPDASSCIGFLHGIPARFAVDMLRQANNDGREISPSLIHLIRKMTGIDGKVTDESGDAGGGQSREAIAETLRTLFNRENYEDFVSSPYDLTLKRISISASEGNRDETGFPIEEHLPSLDEAHLNRQISRMLLAFISDDLHATEYRAYIDKLLEIADGLLDCGDFQLITQIFEALDQHANYKRHHEIRSIAEKALAVLRKPPFVSKAVHSVCRHPEQANRQGGHLLHLMGPGVIPDALNLYAGHPEQESNPILLELLQRYPDETVTEAQKRLRDTRTDYIKRLVILIRETGGKNAADALRPLWGHSDRDVQLEALEGLLKFNDKWGLLFLRKALKANVPGISDQAISLAAKYKVFEVADDLAAMLKRKILFKSDYEKNAVLIKAMGEIGNPSVLPVLKKLAGMTLSFHPKKLAGMKRLLYRSLIGYPPHAVQALLRRGLKSSDEKIRKICRQGLQSPAPALRNQLTRADNG
ncbi:MAG: HEAT repeat domain-containing protein [Thermodesulfobacteriota bacterium]